MRIAYQIEGTPKTTEFTVNSTEKIVVSIAKVNGKERVTFWKWFLSSNTGQWTPNKARGISMDRTLYDEIIEPFMHANPKGL